MTTNIVFSESIDGLPLKMDGGNFIGFAVDDSPYVLHWNPPTDCYIGVGLTILDLDGTALPISVLCREENANFIVRHIRVYTGTVDEPSGDDQVVTRQSSLDESRSSFGHRDERQ